MSDSESDYDHWPDDATAVSSSATATPGYDTHNGLHECEYQPANEDKAPSQKSDSKKSERKKDAPKKDEQVAIPAPPPPFPYAYGPPYMPSYAPQYVCYPSAYYGFRPQPQPQPYGYGYGLPLGYVMPPAPAATQPKDDAKPKEEKKAKDDTKTRDDAKTKDNDNGEKKKEKKSKSKPEPMKWQGRTRAEVEEDELMIAAREGAFAKRKVAPIGLKEDQPIWVIMDDGKPHIRTFAETKDMKGEWREDPRYEGSLYFLCDQQEKGKDEGAKKEKKKGGKKG